MNKRDKTRISLKFKEIAKEVKEFLSSDENHVYPAYHSDVILVNNFEEVREEILINLLNDQIYAGKFSEEYLEKLLKEKMTAMIHDIREQTIWWTLLSRQQKCLNEDTKSSSLAGEKRGGTSDFHAPQTTRTVSFFGLLLNRCRVKIDGSRGLIVQRLM